jgi:hypothetical protein
MSEATDQVVEEATPVVDSTQDSSLLELKQKQLQLLLKRI